MHCASIRRLAMTSAAALALAASTGSYASASPGDETAPTERRVEVRKIAGPDRQIVIAGLPGDGFKWRGAMLGVAFVPLTPELRRHFGAPEDQGILVSKVIADSAAQAAGVEVGDIITRIDGEPVREGSEFAHRIRARKAGETVALEVLRGGRTRSLSATLVESDAPALLEKKAIFMRCADENGEKDCPEPTLLGQLECGDEGQCEVKVICKDGGDCTCTVNGEDKPCPEGLGKE
jgi:hypothetical protein